MSAARKPRFTRTNTSSQREWLRYQLALLAMCPPHLLGQGPDLHGVAQDRVVAVPLHEVGPTHERPVLGRPPIVVPPVDVGEVNGRLERPDAEDVAGATGIGDRL